MLECDLEKEALVRRRPAMFRDGITNREGLGKGGKLARGILRNQLQDTAVSSG